MSLADLLAESRGGRDRAESAAYRMLAPDGPRCDDPLRDVEPPSLDPVVFGEFLPTNSGSAVPDWWCKPCDAYWSGRGGSRCWSCGHLPGTTR